MPGAYPAPRFGAPIQDLANSTVTETGGTQKSVPGVFAEKAPKASPALTGLASIETLSTSAPGSTNPGSSAVLKSIDGTLKFKFPSWAPPNTLSTESPGSIETGPLSIDIVRTGGFGSYGNIYLTSRVTAAIPAGQFDIGVGSYMSACNLTGGGVAGAWIGANSPSTGTDYGGNPLSQTWTKGSISALEINVGNRWGELGQQRDWNRADRWTNGITIVPAIVPATDGPGNNAVNGTFGTSLLKDSLSPAKWWTGHLVGRDAIVPTGTAFQINGGFTASSAYDILNTEGYYRVGLDLSGGIFASSQIRGSGWSVDKTGRLSVGSANDPLAMVHVRGANAPPSLTADTEQLLNLTGNTGSQLAAGVLASGAYPVWLQGKSASNNNSANPITLNPLGGPVAVGSLTNFSDTFTVTGGITATGAVRGYSFIGALYTPPSASSAGTQGQMVADGNYFYVCVAANTWKRVTLSSW